MAGCVCLPVAVNALLTVDGATLAGGGTWAYLHLAEIATLRNDNHYLLDYNIHWPQVAPWMFVCAGIAVLPVAMCGLCGALGRTRTALSLHALLLLLLVLVHAAVAVLVFLYIDGEPTETFIKDSVFDGIQNAKTEPEILKAFGRLERRLRCCGAHDVTDYRMWPTALDRRPLSCCSHDTLAAVCPFSSREVNMRFGCAQVAIKKTSRLDDFLMVGTVTVGVLELIGLAAASMVLASRTSRAPHNQIESPEAPTETTVQRHAKLTTVKKEPEPGARAPTARLVISRRIKFTMSEANANFEPKTTQNVNLSELAASITVASHANSASHDLPIYVQELPPFNEFRIKLLNFKASFRDTLLRSYEKFNTHTPEPVDTEWHANSKRGQSSRSAAQTTCRSSKPLLPITRTCLQGLQIYIAPKDLLRLSPRIDVAETVPVARKIPPVIPWCDSDHPRIRAYTRRSTNASTMTARRPPPKTCTTLRNATRTIGLYDVSVAQVTLICCSMFIVKHSARVAGENHLPNRYVSEMDTVCG
ncbi:CD63 antigen [Eumeta japonica]|uniref:CD63 antigen n=1 Tax=Eumeta variegata TaxID=151549 RepID=A0A4C1Z847_EUMVA|nr:CD63 antigen [Eumeta japonica]